MNKPSRRTWMAGGIAIAGASGLAAAAKIAGRYGLLPPDNGGFYGPGHALTYAAQRLITARSYAREFRRDQISAKPFANETQPPDAKFQRLRATSFTDWRLSIEGMVAQPTQFSLSDLRRLPMHNQITHLACEEGWSYVAEWTGVRLSRLLEEVGVQSGARYVLYSSIQPGWSDSIDMADALHPQTIVTLSMNGAHLPVEFGGPLRLRVPRQLGYKSVKYIHRITVAANLKDFQPSSYSWYAGM